MSVVQTEVKNKVAVITYNNPPLNILTMSNLKLIEDAVKEADENQDVSVILFTMAMQKKVFCAVMELVRDALINLGIGIPDQVAVVAAEEGVADEYISTLEMGLWGGQPTGGLDFGGSLNAEASIAMANQFDFYDGGGLDLAVLGIGEIDQHGNNNVTKFGPKVPGPGGFINISQNTENIVFVGTFMIGGKAHIEDGKLVIDSQGKGPKFVEKVEQVSFSGKYANENGQKVLYVTERAVFDLYDGKVRLIEYAPGVDVQKDILDLMDFEPEISDDLKEMHPGLFQEEWGGLKEIIKNK